MQVTYCRRWNFKRHTPMDPLTAEQAIGRDKKGQEYAVVLGASEGQAPEAVIEIVWQNKFAGVWFFDGFGRRSLNYAFRRTGDKLFLFDIIQYDYPHEQARTLADASRTDHITFSEDGQTHEVVTDDQAHEKITTDRRNVDVRSHWEPVPKFGDWQSLARWNRG